MNSEGQDAIIVRKGTKSSVYLLVPVLIELTTPRGLSSDRSTFIPPALVQLSSLADKNTHMLISIIRSFNAGTNDEKRQG